MGANITIPTLVKIREGIRINLTLSVSHAIERDVTQTRIKPEIQELFNTQKLDRKLTPEDYEECGKTNAISFWFVGDSSLIYRVGKEITQEDFDRIEKTLQSIEFRMKDERKPSSNQAD